jgi:predicted DNA-binding transcriptional regulator YafY
MPDKTTRRTLSRQWELLKLLPTGGLGKTAQSLAEEIRNLGFTVSKRQIERDLQELRAAFELECNDKNAPYGWKWSKNASLNMPGMSVAEALSLQMAKNSIESMLPAPIMQSLEPRFRQAQGKLASLGQDSSTASWYGKVRSVSPTLVMQPPFIAEEVLTCVQEALLQDEQIELHYQAFDAEEPKVLCVNPLALVNRGVVSYLVATAWGYSDVRLYALQRCSQAKRLYQPIQRPAAFDIDQYIAQGALQFGQGQTITLQAKVSEQLARILTETAISTQQTLADGLLTATVQDTWQLEWWILSQSNQIEVLAPIALREKIASRIAHAYQCYFSAQ